MRTSKKLLSFFLAVVMVVTTCSVGFTAFAKSNDNPLWQTTGVDADSAFNTLNKLADNLPSLLMGIDVVKNAVYEKGAKKFGTTVDKLTDEQKKQIESETTLQDLLGVLQPTLIGALASTSQSDFVRNIYGDTATGDLSSYNYLSGSEGTVDYYTLAALCYNYKDNSSLSKESREQLEEWLYGAKDDRTLSGRDASGKTVKYSANSLWYLATLYQQQTSNEEEIIAKVTEIGQRYNKAFKDQKIFNLSLDGESYIGSTYETASLYQLKQCDYALTAEDQAVVDDRISVYNKMMDVYGIGIKVNDVAELLYYGFGMGASAVQASLYIKLIQDGGLNLTASVESSGVTGTPLTMNGFKINATENNIFARVEAALCESMGVKNLDSAIKKLMGMGESDELDADTLNTLSNFLIDGVINADLLTKALLEKHINAYESSYYPYLLKGLAVNFGNDGEPMSLDEINAAIDAQLPKGYSKDWKDGDTFFISDEELDQLHDLLNNIAWLNGLDKNGKGQTLVTDLFRDGTVTFTDSYGDGKKKTIKIPDSLKSSGTLDFWYQIANLYSRQNIDAGSASLKSNNYISLMKAFSGDYPREVKISKTEYTASNSLVDYSNSDEGTGINKNENSATSYSKADIQKWANDSYNYIVTKTLSKNLGIDVNELGKPKTNAYKYDEKFIMNDLIDVDTVFNKIIEKKTAIQTDVVLTDAQKAILNGDNTDLTGSVGTEIVNLILNNTIGDIVNPNTSTGAIVDKVLKSLLKTEVNLQAVLTDIWSDLVDNPIKTIVNLLPVLAVLVNELIEPILFAEVGDAQKSTNTGLLYDVLGDGALESMNAKSGSYIGIDQLSWDLNALLPQLMHWLKNDGSYESVGGTYWNDGNAKTGYLSYYNNLGYDTKDYTANDLISDNNLVLKYDKVIDKNGKELTYKESKDKDGKTVYTYSYNGNTADNLTDVLANIPSATRFNVQYTYEAGVPRITGIYIADKALKYAKISDLEGILSDAIKAQDGQIGTGLYEVIDELATLFTKAVDTYVNTPELRNQVKGYANDGTDAAVNRGLNNITVALPQLFDIMENLGADKYGVPKNAWTYCYDGKIVVGKDASTGDDGVVSNAKMTEFKNFAANPDPVKIFDCFAQIFVEDWLDAILGLVNNVISVDDSEFSKNLPIVTGLLNSVGGFDKSSALTDLFNSIFQITRESDYSFTFENQSSGFVGLDKDNAYFLITNVSKLVDVVKALIDSFKKSDDNKGNGDGTTSLSDIAMKALANNADVSAASDTQMSPVDLSNYTNDEIGTVDKTIAKLDSMLSSLLVDSSINGYNLSKTSNIVTGVVSLLSNYIGADASNQVIDLLNTYLYYLNGEDQRSADSDGNVDPKDIYTNEGLTTVVVRTFALVETLVASLTDKYAYTYKENGSDKEAKYNLISEAVNGLISPDSLAVRIKETEFGGASKQIKKLDSWSDAIEKNGTINVDINWGITKGDRDEFLSAFSASIRILTSIVGVILLDTGIYENALYPALNAIAQQTGIKIDTPKQLADASNEYHDELVKGLVNPLVSWLDTFLQKPATTLINTIIGLSAVLDDTNTKAGTVASIVSGAVTPVQNELNGAANILKLTSSDLGALSPTLASLLEKISSDTFDQFTKVNGNQELGFKVNGVALSGNNIIPIVNTILAKFNIKLNNINWNFVSKCTPGKAVTYVLEYLVDTVLANDNLKAISDLIGGDNIVSTIISAIQSGDIDAHALLKLINKVLNLTQNPTLFAWSFEQYLQQAVEGFTYPQGMTKAQADEAAQDIDAVINNIFPVLASLGVNLGGNNLKDILSANVFKNELITKLVFTIYSGISSNATVASVMSGLGVVSSPADVAKLLTDTSYGATFTDAANFLASASSWDALVKTETKNKCDCGEANCTAGTTTTKTYPTINWGFKDGAANAQQGFVNALVAALRPLYPVVSILLNEGSAEVGTAVIEILKTIDSESKALTFKNGVLTITVKDEKNADSKDSVIKIDVNSALKDLKIYGTNAYNSAIIPLMEALGAKNIKTAAEYKNSIAQAKDNLLLDILNPILGANNSILNDIVANPLEAICTILPNLAVFFDAEGLSQFLNNLLAPVTQLISALTEVVDVNAVVAELLDYLFTKGKIDKDVVNNIVAALAGQSNKNLSDVIAAKLGMAKGSLKVDLNNISAINVSDAVVPIINLILSDPNIIKASKKSTTSCPCSSSKCPNKLTNAQIKENAAANETSEKIIGYVHQIKIGNIDWNLLASLGDRVTYTSKATDLNGNALTGKRLENVDYGKTLITVLRYVLNTVKNNINPLNSILTNIDAIAKNDTLKAIISNVITQIKTHSADQIIVGLYYFFVGEPTDTYWDFTGYKTKNSTFKFPKGVNASDVAALVSFLDAIIDEADLNALLNQYLYTDSLINTLTKAIYTNIEKVKINNSIAIGDILSILDVDVTSNGVANLLVNAKYGETKQFASASEAIKNAGSWAKVDFNKLSWGVKDQKTFLNALVAVLRPLYGVLDAILADGSIAVLKGVTIPGSNAYENSIVPLLEALGCEKIVSFKQYKNDIDKAYDNLLLDILNPLFGFVDSVVSSPLDTIASALPNLALFIGNDGITQFAVNLITPVTQVIKAVAPVIDVDALLYDLTKVELNGKKISITKLDEFLGQYTDGGKLIATLNSFLTTTGISIPEIDWLGLASLGKTTKTSSAVKTIGDRLVVKADTSKVIIAVLRYVLNAVLSNANAIKGLLGDSYKGTLKNILDMIFGMNADQLLALVFRLVNITQSPTEVFWSYKEYKHQMSKFKYPDGISAEDAENAVGQLDGAVDGVMALLSSLGVVSSSNLQGVVGDLLFTNEMVTKLASALYGALDTDKISPYLSMAGIDVTTKGVAKLLTDKSYGKTFTSAAKTIKSAKSWSKVTKVNWGFKDGAANAQQGFINAVTAVLRPFLDVLGPFLNGSNLELGNILYGVVVGLDIKTGNKKKGETLVSLKNGKLTIKTQSNGKYSTALSLNLANLKTLKTLNLYGSNGYENAIVPLLDVLQVENSQIKTFDQYVKDCKKAKDNILLDVLNPLMSFVSNVLDKPFDTLTSVLPNLAYFIDNGGVPQLLDNLLSPVTAFLKDAKKQGVDVDKIIKMIAGKDLGTIITKALKINGVKIKLSLTNLKACNIDDVVYPLVTSLLKSTGIVLPYFDFATIASHGEAVTSTSKAENAAGKFTNKEVIANKGEVLVALLRYISDTLIKNAKTLKSLISNIDAIKKNDMLKSIITSVFNTIGIAEKDDIVRAVFYFLKSEPTNAFWDYTAYKTGTFDFSYPEGIDTDFLKNLPPMLDGLVGGLLDLNATIGGLIFKDDIINSLATGLYGAIEGVKVGDGSLTSLLAQTGIDFSTKNVAKLLTDEAYGQTYESQAKIIAAAGSWSKVNKDSLKWGVKDADTFFHALVAVLRPIYGVLDVLLNGASLGIFDIVRIPGSNGYTSSIVPLMEAFSMYNIKTQYQYRQDIKEAYDNILLDIINPLWDKVEDILSAPLETLFAILPNLALFIGNDGLCQIIDNLLTPVSALVDAIKPVVNLNDLLTAVLSALNVDLNSTLAKIGITNFSLDIYDLNATLKPLLSGDAIIPLVNNLLGLIKIGGQPLGLKLNDVNWLQLASHGKTIVSASQAATYGARIYVEGDSSETLIAVLRYLIETVNTGDNFDKINGLIGGLLGDGSNATVSDVVNQVLGMLQGDTDKVIADLVDLLQTLA